MSSQMNQRASCRHLTHKYPAYLGCTLGEVCVLVGGYLICDLLISVIISLFVGRFFLVMIAAFLLSLPLIRLTARLIGRFKEHKQQNYIVIVTRHWLHQKFGIYIPFVMREGKWSTRRRLS